MGHICFLSYHVTPVAYILETPNVYIVYSVPMYLTISSFKKKYFLFFSHGVFFLLKINFEFTYMMSAVLRLLVIPHKEILVLDTAIFLLESTHLVLIDPFYYCNSVSSN
jgi:hypothetical protein